MFSTLNCCRAPLAASDPAPAPVAVNLAESDVDSFAAHLRSTLPKVAEGDKAPFNVDNYFDDYDISRQGRAFLWSVLELLDRQNGHSASLGEWHILYCNNTPLMCTGRFGGPCDFLEHY